MPPGQEVKGGLGDGGRGAEGRGREGGTSLSPFPRGSALVGSTHNWSGTKNAVKTFIPREGSLWSWEALDQPTWTRHKERISLCGSRDSRRWIAGWKQEESKGFVSAARCHSRWHDGCRDDDVRESILALKPTHLLTLTMRKTANGKAERDFLWLTWSQRWHTFLRLWKAEEGETPEFVAVLEPHQSGWPHLHAVLKGSVPTEARIRAWWKECGGGWRIQLEVLRKEGAYIAKYLTKLSALPEDLRALLSENKVRLVYRSRGLRREKQANGWVWYAGRREACEGFIQAAREGRLRGSKDADNHG